MATANPTETRRVPPAATRQTRTEKGISFARGPALILGTILLAAGLYLMYKAHSYPKFSTNFPNGTAHEDGKFIVGLFGANGWTGLFTAVCGGLLLFGAAQHLMAKTMSLIVGVALGAAAVIALVSGDVLGMAAANHWTELGWAVAAVILLFNTLAPRRRREVVVTDGPVAADRRAYGEPVVAREPVADREPVAAREPVAEHGTAVEGEPVAAREPVADRAADQAPADRAAEPATEAEPPTSPLHRA